MVSLAASKRHLPGLAYPVLGTGIDVAEEPTRVYPAVVAPNEVPEVSSLGVCIWDEARKVDEVDEDFSAPLLDLPSAVRKVTIFGIHIAPTEAVHL